MSKLTLPGVLLALLFLGNGTASGQSICPLNGTPSPHLVCVLPQVYGPFGLGPGQGAPLIFNKHQSHFQGTFLTSLDPINEAVGIQVSQLPTASPSSGIIFTYDPALKTFSPSIDESLGPILGERSDTIGRHKLYVAFSFQYFDFNSIDGQNLNRLHTVFQHATFLPPFPPGSGIVSCPNTTGLTVKNGYANAMGVAPCFVRDFISSTVSMDLTVHQYTIYATYGITPRLDVSVAIPFLNVQTTVGADTTITSNSVPPVDPVNYPGGVYHAFNPVTVPTCPQLPLTTPCLHATFSNSGTATGIGDVLLRGKYEIYKGERFGVALGVDVRVPSGDAQNFLGSGSTGVKPFGVFSYKGRVSPHAEIGYEVNGNSILAGQFVGATATNTKGSMPDRFVYIVGADVAVTRRLTGAFDIYGQRLFGVPQLYPSTYTDLGKCNDVNCDILTPGTAHPDLLVRQNTDYNITNASLGLKFRVFGHLVITGNVLLKLDDNGLRSKAIPLVGASYTL
ncbi:MAG: transporter [Candidatus Acidiferrum sp.]|jgi:hypothetical protein